MKIKNLLFTVLAILFAANALALDHGSLIVKDTPLYEQRDGAVAGEPVAGQTLSFKVVTIDGKTWSWTDLSGVEIMNQGFSSQLRWWKGTNKDTDKTENNLTGRISGTQQTYGTTTNVPAINPCIVTIFQHVSGGEWVFRETDDFSYDYTKANSADEADEAAPVINTAAVEEQTATSVTLSLSVTESSNDYFYYITDEENGYQEVAFVDNPNIKILEETDYNLTIVAVDFSGNVSEAKSIQITGEKFECNNLLDTKTLYRKDGENPYFAPGWTPNDNYSFSIEDNEVSINLNDATFDMWQAQFPIFVETPVALEAGEKYSLIIDVATNKNLPFYAKFFDGNDEVFMEIPKVTVNTPGTALSNLDIVCPAGLTQISKILFDFGGNAAATEMTISNISICGKSIEAGVGNVVESDAIQINQSNAYIQVTSTHAIKNAVLYAITGQSQVVSLKDNQLQTSHLNQGIYLLSLEDISGYKRAFKFIIK